MEYGEGHEHEKYVTRRDRLQSKYTIVEHGESDEHEFDV